MTPYNHAPTLVDTHSIGQVFAFGYNTVMLDSTEFHGGPFDGLVEEAHLDDDIPDYVSRGSAIYRHISIGGYVAGTTVSVYRFLKSVPAGEVQATLDKLEP